ncbi:unnamed protein product [Mytilus edulis]|uniref:ZMYM2-like/QRICH1 C-terminal domain-containing protein n=1 Tax=Mytilus edulis TaxID=6550 RepID=A0A8S3TBZ1_MYTED|nr:unnamed protein product [Mytilus edulis]
MDDIDLLEWDPIFLTQSSYSQVSEEKESDILSYFDLKPSDNDLEITRHQFRHGQPETVKSLQNKIEESVPKNSVKKYKWGYNAFNSWQAERRLRPISDNLGIPPNCLQKDLVHEDVSKANAGGLKHRKVVSKCVRAFENPENRNKCIVTVFEKYKSLCPANGGKDCFYLTPLKHIKDGQWYSNNPIGHNTLQGTVKRLCASIGLTGKRTNHSLRASAATRLYNAGIEEQRVAETTGHRSNAVRVYKRTSADQQIEASNILYGLRPSDGRKKAKPSAAAGAPVSSASVECSTDESDKKTVTCNFSFNFSL